MILDDIQSKLEEVDSKVYYGMADKEVQEQIWDFTVFGRSTLKVSPNRTGYSDYYDVTIFRENFIPEGIDRDVIEKMLEIDGMRLANADGSFEYLAKPKTNAVVEALTLHFVRARK